MNELRISFIQSAIAWEDKTQNLHDFYARVFSLKGLSDLVVLPEMFSTGFSMQASYLAETNEGNTIQTVRQWAKESNLAIAGSFLAKNAENRLFNRGFFVTPEGKSHFSDKRHLFRMAEEHHLFTAGNSYTIIPYKGWNIRLIVCYDLRFPVWIRNRSNEYDLLLCVANWPQPRANAWDILLKARAIENLCYVCGVNRIEKDGNGISYQGDSALIDFKGNLLAQAEKNQPAVITDCLYKRDLEAFRAKFPAWEDADYFEYACMI
ncbi:amidohydrolase [Bacteroidia bacterium]|nr:amidohydrolase [Bacteroidia bacterium]